MAAPATRSMGAARWQVEQVLSLAPRPTSIAAAEPLAVPTRWVATGCDHRAVWGRCVGSGGEPYDCVADHVQVAFRCTCPSRQLPCKHVLALLLMWSRELVAVVAADAPAHVAAWLATVSPAATTDPAPDAPDAPAPAPVAGASPRPAAPPDLTAQRDDRVARMLAGLVELDRWIDDRVRTGLADAVLARYDTWDALAARLVDAQVGGLANRVRRLAGLVGAHPQWHEAMIAELSLLHLLAHAGRRLPMLPPDLADSVATAIGWQIRQSDVLAGVPHTDHWVVVGRSDVREDRIVVRRVWLRGRTTQEWAMVLSFGTNGQSLDASLPVGSQVHADLFRYPGALGLRALVGTLHAAPVSCPDPTEALAAHTVHGACAAIGEAVIVEPWIERVPVCIVAAPARDHGRWYLTDHTGALPLVERSSGLATLLSCSGGRPVHIVAEWTPLGLVPLAVHLPDRSLDIGPSL